MGPPWITFAAGLCKQSKAYQIKWKIQVREREHNYTLSIYGLPPTINIMIRGVRISIAILFSLLCGATKILQYTFIVNILTVSGSYHGARWYRTRYSMDAGHPDLMSRLLTCYSLAPWPHKWNCFQVVDFQIFYGRRTPRSNVQAPSLLKSSAMAINETAFKL